MQEFARSGRAANSPPRSSNVALEPADVERFAADVKASVGRVVLSQDAAVTTCMAALLADGHILLEDVPGVGKTTLARALARSLGLTFSRIQFTSDLLPSDIVGSAAPDPSASPPGSGGLVFQPGPVFACVVLADELNRTTPRTQSSLLEAMSDRQVTVDGVTHPLPRPFMVIATQNPLEHHGTYPLPESQLDRFMVRLCLGYPDADAERSLLLAPPGDGVVEEVEQVIPDGVVGELQAMLARVRVDGSVADYALAIATATRGHEALAVGASTRAAMSLMRLARAHALIQGRDFVTPADVKLLAGPALTHRLVPHHSADPSRSEVQGILDHIISVVPVPE